MKWMARSMIVASFLSTPCTGVVRAEPVPGNPIDGLRQALRAPARSPEQRDRSIESWTERLTLPADLGHALVLDEWRDEDLDTSIAAIDRLHRGQLMQRFEQAVRRVMAQGDPDSQAAVADLIGSLGVTAHGVSSPHSTGYIFTAELAQLVRQGGPRVRLAAARALGRIHPDLAVALPALDELLAAPDPAERLAAAAALLDVVQVAAQLTARSRNATGVQATWKDLVRVGQEVVPVAGHGLGDAHPQVRLLCVAAIGQAVGAVGRRLPPTTAAQLGAHPDELAPPDSAAAADWLPFWEAVRNQGPALARVLDDSQASVVLQTCQTLQEIANLRLRAEDGSTRPMPEGLTAVLPVLARRVADPDLRIRLAVVDVLELLGPAAAPAVDALVLALNDPNRFVCRAAVRTLGKIGPPAAVAAVPALARLRHDRDPDLARLAAGLLERLGSPGGDVVPVAGPREKGSVPAGAAIPER